MPSKTRIKICGITNLEDALLAIKCGADELGFNFYKKSPRYITPNDAEAIIRKLPMGIIRVGVFVNETEQKICKIAGMANLDAVQLHGDENRAFVQSLNETAGLAVIQTIRVTPDFRSEAVDDCAADAILLDSYSGTERGGTGETFDWNIGQQISQRIPILYLAGGLTADNVSDAIIKVRPYAVDACSRIESKPGKKDAAKLERFINAVRETI